MTKFKVKFVPIREPAPGRAVFSADDAELTPPAGLLLVATLHGEPVGCGALKSHDGAPAELKRMWVAPTARYAASHNGRRLSCANG